MNREIEVLKKHNAENIEGYVLVNNWGYTFSVDGKRYDARFWANCYGSSPNCWRVSANDGNRELAKRIEKELNSLI